MKNKIIGIFCMAPLVALIVFVLIKAAPELIPVFKEAFDLSGIPLKSWLTALSILAGLAGLIFLFRCGWKKFIK